MLIHFATILSLLQYKAPWSFTIITILDYFTYHAPRQKLTGMREGLKGSQTLDVFFFFWYLCQKMRIHYACQLLSYFLATDFTHLWRKGRQEQRREDNNYIRMDRVRVRWSLIKAEDREGWRKVVARSSSMPQLSFRLQDEWEWVTKSEILLPRLFTCIKERVMT